MGQLLYSSRRTELKISHPADIPRGVFASVKHQKNVPRTAEHILSLFFGFGI